MKKDDKNTIIFTDATIKRLIKIANFEQEKFDEWFANEKKLYEKNEKEKIITFRNATLSKLKKIVDIEQSEAGNKFDELYSYKYEIKESEKLFLKEIIKDNKFFLRNYNEQTLTVKFIGRILNKIKFGNKHVKDWYGYQIGCELNGYTLSGEPDFIVATGIEVPETPYFFLQEYKRSVNPTGDPEYQVLAAMLVAMNLTKKNVIRGGYIIGRLWNFIILEKLKNGKYNYFVSKAFDCLDYDSLKQIYINLQAVKFLYCK